MRSANIYESHNQLMATLASFSFGDAGAAMLVEATEEADRRIATALREGECAIDRQALPDKIRLMKLPRSGRSHKVDRNILRRQLRDLT